ncbi:MAG: hypothetical protein ACUVQ0_01415 [Thermoproteota archaeon]
MTRNTSRSLRQHRLTVALYLSVREKARIISLIPQGINALRGFLLSLGKQCLKKGL